MDEPLSHKRAPKSLTSIDPEQSCSSTMASGVSLNENVTKFFRDLKLICWTQLPYFVRIFSIVLVLPSSTNDFLNVSEWRSCLIQFDGTQEAD